MEEPHVGQNLPTGPKASASTVLSLKEEIQPIGSSAWRGVSGSNSSSQRSVLA